MKRNILLVEPDYRSKFPPLGLMRLATYHRGRGDAVTFVRGKHEGYRSQLWHRIYVSSLFTWELPRTVETLKYYRPAVERAEDLIVGGVGVSLLPSYVRENADCRILTGLVDKGGEIDPLSGPLHFVVPDYSILEKCDYSYSPQDAYFVKITVGCIRSCKFCAVPVLEPKFGMGYALKSQLERINRSHGEKQNLVVMDNNILGVDGLENIFAEIRDAGFASGAKRGKRMRSVDFNQGLDCRLIEDRHADLLGSICAHPIRLAFDHDGVEKPYRAAIKRLADVGYREFTNYLLFNFVDKPESLYHRMAVNMDLNERLGLAITAFPMRFVPMDDVNKRHISNGWKWRYLRGMQCVLLATRGMVSPNPTFFHRAFGSSLTEFLEILAMPDRYIVWRSAYETNGADDWRAAFRRLSSSERSEFLDVLAHLNKSRMREREIQSMTRFRDLLEHYYPEGKTAANRPPEQDLAVQGLATGYDYEVAGPGSRVRQTESTGVSEQSSPVVETSKVGGMITVSS
jgi:hypothetical protein